MFALFCCEMNKTQLIFFSLCLFKSDGNSGFLRAARAGNLEKVLEYLRSSIDINTSNAVRKH